MITQPDGSKLRNADHPDYATWQNMLQRCRYTKHACYHRYGGRGIRVCKRWLNSFPAFVSDMGPRPEGMTLDRIDNDGDYTPENCRWAGLRTQANNKSVNQKITYKNETLSMSQWSRRTGIPVPTIANRLSKGWRPEDILHKGHKREDRRGHRNQAAKLSERDVREIKKLLRNGNSQPDIACQFGVSNRTISAINTGAAWGHI